MPVQRLNATNRTRGEYTKRRARFPFHISLSWRAIPRAYSTCTLRDRNELAAHIKLFAKQCGESAIKRGPLFSRIANHENDGAAAILARTRENPYSRGLIRFVSARGLRFMYDSIHRRSLVKKGESISHLTRARREAADGISPAS